MISNRELAAAIWLVILVVWGAATSAPIRRCMRGLIRALFARKFAASIVLGAAYASAWVYAARAAGLWDSALVGETAIWFILSGLTSMASVSVLRDRQRFFTQATLRIFSAAGFLVAIANLFVLPLYGELVLTPFLGLLAGVTALPRKTADDATAIRTAQALLSLAGAAFLIYGVVTLATDWSVSLATYAGRDVALPIWLSLVWLPFLFSFALVTSYESAFLRIGFATDDGDVRRRARRALVCECGLNVHAVAELGHPWIGRLVRARSPATARRLLSHYKQHRHAASG